MLGALAVVACIHDAPILSLQKIAARPTLASLSSSICVVDYMLIRVLFGYMVNHCHGYCQCRSPIYRLHHSHTIHIKLNSLNPLQLLYDNVFMDHINQVSP